MVKEENYRNAIVFLEKEDAKDYLKEFCKIWKRNLRRKYRIVERNVEFDNYELERIKAYGYRAPHNA